MEIFWLFVEYSDSLDIHIYDFRTKNISSFSANKQVKEYFPDFSPDGRWLAYVANPDGVDEVYVRSVSGEGRIEKVSRGRGRSPLWARSGKELFYRSSDQMWVVDVQTEAIFSAGIPRKLFEISEYTNNYPVRGHDISLDDQRFLMVKLEKRVLSPVTELILIQNWFEELKLRIPTRK